MRSALLAHLVLLPANVLLAFCVLRGADAVLAAAMGAFWPGLPATACLGVAVLFALLWTIPSEARLRHARRQRAVEAGRARWM